MRFLRLHRRNEHGSHYRRGAGSRDVGRRIVRLLPANGPGDVRQSVHPLSFEVPLRLQAPGRRAKGNLRRGDEPLTGVPQMPALVVTRNVTTDSPWPISSNPLAKYNELSRPDSNLRIPLWQLLRASTAAPVFFAPEVLQWDLNDPTKTFKFVDGGLTPYNNPAFLLSRMVTQAPYRLNWKTGERNLLVVSVGTGAAPRLDADVYSRDNVLENVANLPSALMYGAQVDQDVNCRMVGRCVYGDIIDRELGDLIPRDENGEAIPLSQDRGRAFLYARYNADLSGPGLNSMGLGDIDPTTVSKLDSVDYIDDLRRIGQRVGEEVKLEHFGTFVGG